MKIKVRLTICICIISVLISLVILSQMIGDMRHDPEYTVYSGGVSTTEGIYYCENWNGCGWIYHINAAGDVLHMTDSETVNMDFVEEIDVKNGAAYAVFIAVKTDEDGNELKLYRLAQYDSGLALTKISKIFTMDSDENVKSLDVYGDDIYITSIGEKGEKANVYKISPDQLLEADSDEAKEDPESRPYTKKYIEELYSPSSVVYRENGGRRFFADAYYNGSDIVILLDRNQLSGGFEPDLRVAECVDRMHFNLLQQFRLYSNYIIWWAGGLLIWFVLLIFIYTLTRRRNRSVYAFAISETLFAMILLCSVLFVYHQHQENETESTVRYAMLSLGQRLEFMPELKQAGFETADYYESAQYDTQVIELRRFRSAKFSKDFFFDIFVMDNSSGIMVLDAIGHTRENASFVYGGALGDLREKLASHMQSAYDSFLIEGDSFLAVGINDEDPSSDYSLVGICRAEAFETDFWDDSRLIVLFLSVSFIVGSLLLLIIYYLLNQDLAALDRELRNVAIGQTKIFVPEIVSEDTRSMYGSLSEICKRMEEINYEKYRIFEGYYRFAPKKIEKIMEKDSIFDVKNGDMVRVNGTLMLLSTAGEGYFTEGKAKSLRNIISYMSRFTDDREGLLVSQDSALSILRFFFQEESVETVLRATEFLHGNLADEEAEFVSAFLYFEPFVYGVAGINSQSLCYITSEHAREIENYATWFAKMRVPLVITERVAKREDAGQIRHIGFIRLLPDGRRVELYEVIDAETARLRQLKLSSKEKFEETLELFYAKEYYVARNRFSAILRDNPEDLLTRWYVFECERYLNRENTPDDSGELRITDGR